MILKIGAKLDFHPRFREIKHTQYCGKLLDWLFCKNTTNCSTEVVAYDVVWSWIRSDKSNSNAEDKIDKNKRNESNKEIETKETTLLWIIMAIADVWWQICSHIH